jgi:hypothetical protein
MGVLGSAVRAWHCAAAELLGRLIINPDNEPFLLPFVPQVVYLLFFIFIFSHTSRFDKKLMQYGYNDG